MKRENGREAVIFADLNLPDTRSRIIGNSGGAKVVWSRGDSFRAHYSVAGEYYFADFQTNIDGAALAEFTTDANLEGGSGFVCIYPGYTNMDYSSDARVFEVIVPSEQTAVSGGIEEGLNRSMAYADQYSPRGNLHFRNMLSLLKFRLEGDIAGDVHSVRLTTTGQIAGSHAVFWNNGSPGIYPGYFEDSERFSCITLSGDFKPGVDYYIALWPSVTSGLEMTFSDGNGLYTTLQSSKEIVFSRSEIVDFGAIVLGDEFMGDSPVSISTEHELYCGATDGLKPVTVVIIPEGFTLYELPQYERLARMGLDYVFETEPYHSYKDRFNAYILKVASDESGISIKDGNGNVTEKRNTYFGVSRSQSSYEDLDANSTTVSRFVSANCPDILNGIHSIQEVPIIIVANDSRYGGICHFSPDGYSYCIVPHSLAGGRIEWKYPSITTVSEANPSLGYRNTTDEEYQEIGRSTGDWRNLFLHEFSHALGRLQDEYWKTNNSAVTSRIMAQQTYSVPFGLNVSASYETLPWQELLDPREELIQVNPLYGRIGVYQGGANAMYNVWRSEKVSGMIDNRPYFSAWQRYLIVQRIMTLTGDADAFSFDSWLAKDNPVDPIRDGVATRSSFCLESGSVPLYPMTNPPIVIDE